MRSVYSFFLLFCVLLLSSCTENKSIVMDVDEREANTIVVFLASKGIKAEKTMQVATAAGGGGANLFTIMVSSEDTTRAMAFLNQNGLPRPQSTNLLTIFAKSGLMSSASEETIRYQAGLAEQIAGTIRRIDGVIDAQVQIAFPKEETTIGQQTNTQKITAAVYIKHQGVLDDPNSHLVAKIKRLVAASVSGLDINDVNIIPDRARFLDVNLTSSSEMLSGPTTSYVELMRVKVAQESVGTFQTLFFSLLSLGIFFFLMAITLVWKCYPILKKQGFLKLLSIEPFDLESKQESQDNVPSSEV
jgi:type III secretion protein J